MMPRHCVVRREVRTSHERVALRCGRLEVEMMANSAWAPTLPAIVPCLCVVAVSLLGGSG